MALSPSDRRGLALGGTFTVVVIGLLSFLIGSPNRIVVPQPGAFDHLPMVAVCSGAHELRADVEFAVARLAEHGLLLGPVTDSPCVPCSYEVKGVLRSATCIDGGITVDLRDRWFNDEHAGETLREIDGRGIVLRASIQVPLRVTDDRPATADLGTPLPHDARRLVLAHELVHALGYDHTETRLSKGVVARKPGELMHPQLIASGWGFAGLP